MRFVTPLIIISLIFCQSCSSPRKEKNEVKLGKHKEVKAVESNEEVANKVAKRINDNFVKLKIVFNKVEVINVPQRDLLVSCADFIKYKNGYVLNSIVTHPGRYDVDVDVTYDFHYLNLSTKEIKKIHFQKLHRIESIITENEDLYISGKYFGQNHFLKISNDSLIELPKIENESHSKNWIKLGFYKNKLIALHKDGVYQLESDKWKSISSFSLDDFNRDNGIAQGRSVIPTENIKIFNDKIYFIQEISGSRSSELIELDLKTNNLTEFWSGLGVNDNYKRELYSYSINSEGEIVFVGNRLMDENLMIQTKGSDFDTYVFNNDIKTDDSLTILVKPRITLLKKDHRLIIAENGIFKLYDSKKIEPILKLNNEHEGRGYYSCKFKMRSYVEISDSKIILGGIYGGLVIIDLTSSKVEWVDQNFLRANIGLLDIK
jgi:hypothetical protein